MKISIDNKELYVLTETQKKVIKNNINADLFEEDMKRRLNWVLKHKYEQCFKRLKQQWDPKLVVAGYKTIPTDPEVYAQLVFSQPDYKDRKTRDVEIDKI